MLGLISGLLYLYKDEGGKRYEDILFFCELGGWREFFIWKYENRVVESRINFGERVLVGGWI